MLWFCLRSLCVLIAVVAFLWGCWGDRGDFLGDCIEQFHGVIMVGTGQFESDDIAGFIAFEDNFGFGGMGFGGILGRIFLCFFLFFLGVNKVDLSCVKDPPVGGNNNRDIPIIVLILPSVTASNKGFSILLKLTGNAADRNPLNKHLNVVVKLNQKQGGSVHPAIAGRHINVFGVSCRLDFG